MPKTMFRISRAATASSTVAPAAMPRRTNASHSVDELERPSLDLTREWVVAVDPGLQGSGVAIWDSGTLVHAAVYENPGTTKDWPWAARAARLATTIRGLISHPETVVICEMMEFQGAGARGLGWRSGDMQRTVFFTGLLAGEVAPCPFRLVPVHRWKGQLPKRVVEDRLRKRLGDVKCRELDIRSHAWDAVGIGLWAMGKF